MFISLIYCTPFLKRITVLTSRLIVEAVFSCDAVVAMVVIVIRAHMFIITKCDNICRRPVPKYSL